MAKTPPFTGGVGRSGDATDTTSYGVGWGATLTAAPASITYGTAFTVQTPDGAAVTGATLIRPGAVTHSFNASQR